MSIPANTSITTSGLGRTRPLTSGYQESLSSAGCSDPDGSSDGIAWAASFMSTAAPRDGPVRIF